MLIKKKTGIWNFPNIIMGFALILTNSCENSDSSVTPFGLTTCNMIQGSSSFAGRSSSSVYEYSTDDKLLAIRNYSGSSLELSTTVEEYSLVSKYTSSSGFPMIQTTVYEGGSIYYDQLPVKASISQTEGAITRTDIFTYYFYYDSKNRLAKVSEETKNVVGDWEYDLFIGYNDKDNVTTLKYTWTTGPNTTTTIVASGYDDKPSPYSGLRTWKYLVSWDANDPSGVFAQLSKNNLLGYTAGDWSREITYTYNENGYPISRTITQKNNITAGTNSWVETFAYNCQ